MKQVHLLVQEHMGIKAFLKWQIMELSFLMKFQRFQQQYKQNFYVSSKNVNSFEWAEQVLSLLIYVLLQQQIKICLI